MFPVQVILLLLLATHFEFSIALVKQNLGGIWSLNDEKQSYPNLTGIVPGGIYSDLMKSYVIKDVFLEDNDVETRWVGKTNWTYTRKFVVDQDVLNYQYINIVFDGLDTFSTVYINDVVIGRSENMFIRYVFNVHGALKLGDNVITVKFLSPIEKAKKLYDEQSKEYEVVPTCVPNEYRGECHANHIRKMQASFSWDWGPAVPSVGVWKPVNLEAYNSSVIRDVTVNILTNKTTDSWDLQVTTYFADRVENLRGSILIKLFTDITSIENVYQVDIGKNGNGEFVDFRNFSVPKGNVKLWWPNGWGNANLYVLKVTFVDETQYEQDSKRIKIGFRTIFLEEKLLETGRTFNFLVNGVPMFAKGSNSIPINILPERGQNTTTIRYLLQSAKDVHMNMLRVWGGGIYESDDFYSIADELGILIWQDMMFACSMYPSNENFLRTVSDEVKHQVRRLQHHPSIAIWAGNNENEAALRQNWYGTANNFSLYKDDYIKLYVDTIQNVVLANDPSRQFLTSSPTNGQRSTEEGYIATNPQDPHYGDVHFYNYINDAWDANVYPVPRFASEYGYQSLPSLKTILSATHNISNLQINSTFITNRQHHPLGYIEMHMLIDKIMKLPDININPLKYFKAFIFYGQILQAMAIKIETEHYRKYRSMVNSLNEGYTMGALYWQLNDVWVGPTWSGIDFENNWKMQHYFAKDFFAPVIITGHLTPSRELDIYVVSDLLTRIYNVSVYISVYKWDSFLPMSVEHIAVTEISDGESQKVASFWVDKYLQNANCGDISIARNHCFLYLSLLNNDNTTISPHNYVFPAPLKDVDLKTPIIKINSVTQENAEPQTFNIEIETDVISLFVWISSDGIRGRFSENGFLIVNATKTISFYPDQPTSLVDLQKALAITNYRDVEYI